MKNTLRTALFVLPLLALVALLPACSSENQPAPAPSFALPPKITLDVQSLNLVDRSGMPTTDSPYSSNHFQPTISEAIRQWASDRLQAGGATGQGAVIIKDASLVQQAIPHDASWFTREQASKYVAHAEVEIEVKNAQGYALATAQASRFESLPENPSEAERQKAYFNVLNGLMRDLGVNLEAAINEHMRSFVITAPPSGNVMVPAVPASQMMPAAAPAPMAPSSAVMH